MYFATWPIGTVHFDQLPPAIQAELSSYVVDGMVVNALEPHRTASEGPYIEFSGYKIRVRIVQVSASTYVTYLA